MCLLVRDVVRFDRWTAATAELTKPLKDFQTRHHTRRQTLVRSSTLFLFFLVLLVLFYLISFQIIFYRVLDFFVSDFDREGKTKTMSQQ